MTIEQAANVDCRDDLVHVFPKPEERGERLDRFLAGRFPDLSRSFLQRIVAGGGVTVDGVERAQTFKVTPGQEIVIAFPETDVVDLVPQAMDLAILFENEDIIVLNKPAGLVVHPGPGNPSGTLVNGLLHHIPNLSVGGVYRPGIVHRLDKDTSGVIVAAKSDRGHASLLQQWKDGSVTKEYVALVRGVVSETEGTIDAPIGRSTADRQRMNVRAGGKPAKTRFRVVERFRETTLLNVELITGRTHQIRVHTAFIGHPVVGDRTYNRYHGPFGGNSELIPRQFLHASLLGLVLPETRDVRTFHADLPSDLDTPLKMLRIAEPAGGN
ncbi:RluA family pseudouridine synthase [soil metagenome]